MDRVLYRIKIDDEEYREVINVFDGFEFMCCEQVISFNFKTKEAGLIKNERCSKCGKTFEIEIEEYINYDDVDYHAYEYLKKELEKDD